MRTKNLFRMRRCSSPSAAISSVFPSARPSTALRMENRGRHGSPWNGRNFCLGIEEGRGYSTFGLRESARPNPVSKQGIPTVAALAAKKQTVVNYIQGVVRIPKGFDGVKNVKFAEASAEFISRSGKAVSAPVDPSFVFTGGLE